MRLWIVLKFHRRSEPLSLRKSSKIGLRTMEPSPRTKRHPRNLPNLEHRRLSSLNRFQRRSMAYKLRPMDTPGKMLLSRWIVAQVCPTSLGCDRGTQTDILSFCRGDVGNCFWDEVGKSGQYHHLLSTWETRSFEGC